MSVPTVRTVLFKDFNDFFNPLKAGGIIQVRIVQNCTNPAKHLITL